MRSVLNFLRARATANGSEVLQPWFPEANGLSREMQMIRRSRNEPGGSRWLNYPLGFILWTGIPMLWAAKMCRRQGKEISESQKLPLWKQFFQMLYLAWWKNKSPLDYYSSKCFLPEFRSEAEQYTSIQQLGRLLRHLNKVQYTERLDHKLQAFASLTAAKIPTVEIVEANCNPNFNGVQFKTRQPMTRSLFAELYWSWVDPRQPSRKERATVQGTAPPT